MVSRSAESNEGQPRPLTPSSRTPGTPIKPRLTRVGTSPSKRDEKPKDDKALKSSAKDVAELKDYVWVLPRMIDRVDADLVVCDNSNWVTVWGRARLAQCIVH